MAARSHSKSAKRSPAKSSSRTEQGAAGNTDAIALLKADHRQVAEWFAEFEEASGLARKRDLAQKICKALEVHTTIEEEIFYPAFIEATKDEDTHHEAVLEHGSAKLVIADIEASDPQEDDYYDQRMTVLSEMIKHHVKEEEQPGGMFAKARASDMDLKVLGAAMLERKDELMSESTSLRSQRRSAELTVGG